MTLTELLKQRPVLLADGATGTNLFDMGLTSGDAPDMWNLEKPDNIRALHRSFVDAGSDIILTNTFGSNARRLMLHNAQDQAFELNKAGAELAREVADSAGRPVVVAGSVGPTGDLFAPLGELTFDDAVEVFTIQMEGLKAGGADVAWIETMSAIEEMLAAATAARHVGLAYVITASFDTAGRTMMGIQPASFASSMMSGPDLDGGERPVAVGGNCGVGASDTLYAILAMTGAEPDAVIVCKANAGIPVVKGEHVHYSGSPELMARYAGLAIDAGARIIGGCCGTKPEHLKAMRAAIDTHQKGERPSLESIESACGPLANPPSGNDAAPPVRKGRRRRA
ncbi:MAG: betaine--homocysteine S-methyltransferase [Alphaproteobacteria bacterium]|nr:betaine--homocysteine S-methyltransferase [Alphaproteobacteria bacterium]